jgi:hypothetical protein
MSLPLAVSNLKEANDTLFHELAHALTQVVDTITNGKKLVLNWVQHQRLASKK